LALKTHLIQSNFDRYGKKTKKIEKNLFGQLLRFVA